MNRNLYLVQVSDRYKIMRHTISSPLPFSNVIAEDAGGEKLNKVIQGHSKNFVFC